VGAFGFHAGTGTGRALGMFGVLFGSGGGAGITFAAGHKRGTKNKKRGNEGEGLFHNESE
jgi:hypothetical protein